jgi:hypothetical protein
MEFTALLMFRKAAHITQHSFAILSSHVCLTELLYIPEENHSRVDTSTWTMHVNIMQGDPLKVFTQKIQPMPHPAYSPQKNGGVPVLITELSFCQSLTLACKHEIIESIMFAHRKGLSFSGTHSKSFSNTAWDS